VVRRMTREAAPSIAEELETGEEPGPLAVGVAGST
jgi:hypothetical protein